MITPYVFLLNIKTSAQLKTLRSEWEIIVARSNGSDKLDAQAYLNEINAELRQRAAQPTYLTIAQAPAEMLGMSPFSAGGAGGAVGGAVDSAAAAAKGVGNAVGSVGTGIKTVAIYVGGAAFVLAAAWIYLNSKK